ncbi:hypothetical protein C8R45DRAFT_1093729 [Mycena sanguinolenta]|nr:hypothetical protein C8R45DRAFT_1093729 [Mycena sanguinolenta]
MFSKLVAFGLGALAVVRAAPAVSFQNSLLSCSVNLDASVAPVKSCNAIAPLAEPKYRIYNEAFGNNPVFVGLEDPGVYGTWWIAPSGNPGSNEYIITNAGLRTRAEVNGGAVATTDGEGDSFTISPAGEGTFTIQVPNEDKVWTVIPAGRASAVYLRPQDGSLAAKWRLVPVLD